MKNTYLGLSILFLSFAALQYNDPDPFIWGTYYVLIAVICFFIFRGKYIKWITIAALTGSCIWAISYLPGVLEWFAQGRPNIAGAMKAETPYIENMREFLGLCICILVLGFAVLKKK